MKQSTASLSSFFQSKLKMWAVSSFLLSLILSLVVLHWISKREGEKRAQEIALTTSQAFRGTIFSGDTLAAEIQAKKSFHLEDKEDIIILDPQMKPMIAGRDWHETEFCSEMNVPCTNIFSKSISVITPLYFDESKKNVFGYVYVTINEKINWSYMASLTLGLLASLLVLSLGLIASMSSAFASVSDKLVVWSAELRKSPKNIKFEEGAPFDELEPVQQALLNLKNEISKLEKEARTEGKLMVLRGIAHDVMTPVGQLKKMLGVVKIQLQTQGKPSEDAIQKFEQYLRKIEKIASQVLVLKENQIEKPELPLGLNVQQTVSSILSDLRDEELFKEKYLEIELHGKSNRVAKLSQLDLERIISNLTRNAAHASDQGQKISVSLSDLEDETEISIKDYGVGISPEDMESIFEVDFSTRPSTGTGLGLPIVKTICEKNGARISFSSELNKGTEFKILLPTNGVQYEVQNSAC